MNDAEECLTQIEDLLRKYCYDAHADLAAQCRSRLQTEGELAWQLLDCGDWWGGSGSVADFYLYDQPETSSREQDRDNKAFRDGLILLHSLLRRHHIFSSSADSWSSVFKSWKASGL